MRQELSSCTNSNNWHRHRLEELKISSKNDKYIIYVINNHKLQANKTKCTVNHNEMGTEASSSSNGTSSLFKNREDCNVMNSRPTCVCKMEMQKHTNH